MSTYGLNIVNGCPQNVQQHNLNPTLVCEDRKGVFKDAIIRIRRPSVSCLAMYCISFGRMYIARRIAPRAVIPSRGRYDGLL